MAIEYRCPECGETDSLGVEVRLVLDLIQDDGGPSRLNKQALGAGIEDATWDDDSVMYCRCGHEGPAHTFIPFSGWE